MPSRSLSRGVILLIIDQSHTNCCRCSASVIRRMSMSRIQLLPCMASRTVLLFFVSRLRKQQLQSSMGFDFQPLRAPKACCFATPNCYGCCCRKQFHVEMIARGTAVPAHGFLGATHSFQSHLRRSAEAKCCKSMTPSPPKSFGLETFAQLTLHFPPKMLSPPAQRKFILVSSINSRVPSGSFSVVR